MADSDHVSIVDATDESEDDEMNDLDMNDLEASDVIDEPTTRRRGRSDHSASRSRSPPKHSSSGSSRFRRTSTAPRTAQANLWESRQEKQVDQSVNLMETATFDATPQRGIRPGMSSVRQKSMVDIFLSSDEPQSRGSNHSSDLYATDYHGNNGRVRKWRFFLFFVAAIIVIVVLVVAVPQFGLIHSMTSSDESDNNSENQKTTNPPTKSPTAAPDEEEIEEEVSLPAGITPPKEDRPLPEPDVNPVTEEELAEEELDLNNVPQTSRLKAFEFYVVDQDVTDPAQLEIMGSPAKKALHWITQKDPAQLEIPGLDGDIEVSNAQAEYALLQRYALAVFYYSQQAASSSTSDNSGGRQLQKDPEKSEALANREAFDTTWLSANPICMWRGITCAEDFESVQEIDLSQHLLQGSIPRELLVGAAMPFLTHIHLTDNQLAGPLPQVTAQRDNAGSSLGVAPHKSQLRVMKLDRNQLTGSLEHVLSDSYPQLKQLHLSNNQLTGSMPQQIRYLKLLDVLDVSNNKLSSSLPARSLGRLTSLRVLELGSNGFTGELPAAFGTLTNLEVLSLTANQFKGSIPSSYGDLTNLEKLDLDGNAIAKSVPTQLGQLERLWRMQVDGNSLTGEMPEEVCALRTAGALRFLEADCTSGDITCECCTECY
ncbi:receptor-like protein kinase precursor [Seminavis robusta]|uniref:Receptor-like protein kinase n=1 Tax=Seminavis robusta TaxID=568900 RepID=A0A9N8DT85_9STRA|nr:receptor-like protein kinase precursor [Seminavis robusta]|eukprot:Sro339_g121130.1 receptor-like protein kinase precursor (656) ;mRNA; f:67290-69483